MPLCTHDAVDMDRIPARLAHVHPQARDKLIKGEEADTLEMRAEREIGRNQEVYNTYGDHMGDGRLAVEYGFVGEEYAGEGLRMEVKEVDDGSVVANWHGVLRCMDDTKEAEHAEPAKRSGDLSNAFDALRMDSGTGRGEEADDSLLYAPKTFIIPSADTVNSSTATARPFGPAEEGLYLSHAGQVSFPLSALLALLHLDKPDAERGNGENGEVEDVSSLAKRIRQAADGLEKHYSAIRDREDDNENEVASRSELAKAADSSARIDDTLSEATRRDMESIARAVHQLLQARLASMYMPDKDLSEMFEARDVS